MSFAKNLQTLRNQKKLSQEELAEKLNVSRQAVGKWESNAAQPDLKKMQQISQMFNVDFDTLVNGRIITDNSLKTKVAKENRLLASLIAGGVGLILLSVSLANLLMYFKIPTETSGLVVIFALLIAVPLFVYAGMRYSGFKEEYDDSNIYTPEESKAAYKKFTKLVTASIFLIFMAVCFIAIADLPSLAKFDTNLAQALFMLIIAIAVVTLSYSSIIYSQYNLEPKLTGKALENKKKADKICGLIMLGATLMFLIAGFFFHAFDKAWPVFVVGGLLCAMVSAALKED